MVDIEEGIRRLIVKEELDDLDKLLAPRECDEVPFVSRFSRIKFLEPADALTKSRILVVHALKHLDRVSRFRDEHRKEVFVMLSITQWDNLTTDIEEQEPVIPCFWISTDPGRDLVSFRMKPGVSRESKMVLDWLDAERLLVDHEVFDSATPTLDVPRVYVARSDDALIASVVER